MNHRGKSQEFNRDKDGSAMKKQGRANSGERKRKVIE